MCLVFSILRATQAHHQRKKESRVNNLTRSILSSFCLSGSCEEQPLGMESNTIPDGWLTSSTVLNSGTPAKNARLRYSAGGPWCAAESDLAPYLQVDLGSLHVVCAVATQGNSKAEQWVETYQLQSSTDGTTWTDYKEGGQVRVGHKTSRFFERVVSSFHVHGLW